jgi:putative heme-binding domain-containing protein
MQELGAELITGGLNEAVQVEVLEILRHRDEKQSPWRKLLEHYDEFMSQGTDPLAAHRVALVGGNADLGQALFLNHQSAQCQRCHGVGGHGGIAGPDLKGIATRHDAVYLLESLVYPSAKVVDGYGVVSLSLNDGRSVVGLLQSRTGTSVTVLDGTTPRTFATSTIKEMSSPLSAMPPMAALLTPRELRDVLAYLQTLK